LFLFINCLILALSVCFIAGLIQFGSVVTSSDNRLCSLPSAAFSQGKWAVSGVFVAYELLRLELLSRILSCVNLVSDSCFLMLVYHWTFLIFRCFCHDISLTKTCENYIVFTQWDLNFDWNGVILLFLCVIYLGIHVIVQSL
jgi:hypothetical protein